MPRITEPAKALGKAIKALRIERGMTHAKVGEAMGIHVGQVAKFERGESLTVRNTTTLADVLGTSWSQLVARAETIIEVNNPDAEDGQ